MEWSKAREILGDAVSPDGSVYQLADYVDWSSLVDIEHITLDGEFTVEYLEALVSWVRHVREDK